MENKLDELKRLETIITMAVCDVEGVVTKEEIDRAEYLRNVCGRTYDAINCRWENI
ncbi:MAG: hypothetical protein GY757_19005 [bacterium]|nr:hypothetical protein [bacterium]